MDAAALLDQALSGASREARRDAFVSLISSADDWKLVLAPHVISQQGYELSDGYYPDRATFEAAAPAIAASEEKIQRVLEILGTRFSLDLAELLAREMGIKLVEHLLDHLRTAKGERSLLLQKVLHQADPAWVQLPEARRVIRQRIRTADRGRTQLLIWLAEAGNLREFLEELRELPPTHLDEWHALGKANLSDDDLTHYALAVLGESPEPLAYLLGLDPLPAAVAPRMMSAARPDWLVQAMEIAIVLGLHNRALVALAELGVRLGGRPMAAATAWLTSARLGKELLTRLATQLVREDGRARLSDLIWVQRRSPSANRALEEGRKGIVPDPFDAAALVRQLRGEKVIELVREILGKPRLEMIESVLHPLCGVNRDAAQEVVLLCHGGEGELGRRARDARSWPDVMWPAEPTEEPDT
jgi:hypothetical protein